MPCYTPNKIIKYPDGHIRFLGAMSNQEAQTLTIITDQGEYISPVLVPCGQCIGCRLDYSRTWASRCMLEAMDHETNYFLTLTYNDDHLPPGKKLLPTLVPEAMQLFIKRLRRHYEYTYGHTGIRFYGAGEYGDISGRPHYHIIAFNLPLQDLTVFGKNELGHTFYRSATLEALWPYGYVVIGECTWQSCAYTARYVVKKQKGQTAGVYEEAGIYPEFCRMSRKPGIARNYFEANCDIIYDTDEIILPSVGKKLQSFSPPRYYDNLLKERNELLLAKIKAKRGEKAEARVRLQMQQTDLSEEDYMDLKHTQHKQSAKRLKRILS